MTTVARRSGLWGAEQAIAVAMKINLYAGPAEILDPLEQFLKQPEHSIPGRVVPC
ncbi:hypothetical protein MUU72_07070 [Streptomyces sp. RS10V-4]|uniref:hypothetical protein n=1 Tax=Streptomyces rhizoryzae TaxID=2932493 RepID=UPI00200417B9|nr:hypothetical protein [Streptomyces rhizoryzae]MCK7622865.1 hypothetical protein [Streptomyces rhizoryzae]